MIICLNCKADDLEINSLIAVKPLIMKYFLLLMFRLIMMTNPENMNNFVNIHKVYRLTRQVTVLLAISRVCA